MQVFASREARRRGILLMVLLAAGFVGSYLLVRRYAAFVFHVEELRTWLEGFGLLAPAVFTSLQTAQVIVAPIPGQVVAVVAGYLFGPIAGTVYSLTGVLIGSAIAFSLAKRYGRSFVEEMLHDEVLGRFDGFVEKIGIPGLIAFVIVPGLPDDAICFLGGLTTWRLRTFMAAIAIGRLPAYVLAVYAGGELASGRFVEGMAFIVGFVVISAIGYYRQERIRDIVRTVSRRSPFGE